MGTYGFVKVIGEAAADDTRRHLVKEGVEPTTTVFFETVRQQQLKAEDLKLPPAAGEVQWFEAGSKKSIPVPKQVIAPKKPQEK